MSLNSTQINVGCFTKVALRDCTLEILLLTCLHKQ